MVGKLQKRGDKKELDMKGEKKIEKAEGMEEYGKKRRNGRRSG